MADRLHILLRELLALPGLPGDSPAVRRYLEGIWGPLADQMEVSPLGSLHARVLGSRPAPRPCVMVSAHLDSIALAVSEIEEGFLRLIPVGRFDPRVLLGQRLVVHGRRAIPGIVLQRVQGKTGTKTDSQPLQIEDLCVDCGLPDARLRKLVSRGDPVTFAQLPLILGNGRLVGHSLDNRGSLAALTLCLENLHANRPEWDVVFAATAHEEITFSGGQTSAELIHPDAAVIVDVTYGRTPDLPEHLTFPLGDGPTNGWGAHVHPAMHDSLRKVAEQAGIPLAEEWMPEDSGTEAADIQLTHRGVPTAVLSLPILHMHSPVEIVDPEDIRKTANLLAKFLLGMTEPLYHRGRRV